MALFKKAALERLTSLEKLDSTLKVVSIKGWMALSFFVVLAVGVVIWSFLGSIPIGVSGKSIVFDPVSSVRIRTATEGTVKEIKIKPGDPVSKGQIVVVLDNPALMTRLQDQQALVTAIQKELGSSDQILFQLLLEQRTLKSLEEQVALLNVTSPIEGRLSWIDTICGDLVEPNQLLMWAQAPFSVENFKILAFLPLFSGQQIKEGMSVNTALDVVNTAEYGMIRGTVKQLLPYPISASDYYMEKIPSAPLREYLIDPQVPTLLVVIEPILDSTTPSGLKWTSPQGPPHPISPGTLGSSRITLQTVSPIAYVLPIFQQEKKEE